MPDLELNCIECSNIFVFSDKDQQTFYRLNQPQPQRCEKCRPTRRKLAAIETGTAEKAARYEIICDRCGKKDAVPFPPKPGRAVLCTTCFGASRARKNI